MSKHKICIHCKMLEAAAQLDLARGGEGGRVGELVQARSNSCASTPTSLPSQDVRAGLWLLMKAPGGLGELHRLPRGGSRRSQPGPGRKVSVPPKCGEGCNSCPSSPGHRPSHSCAGHSPEATAIRGGRKGPSSLNCPRSPGPGKASGLQPWGPGESAWGRGFSVTTSCGAW